MKNVKYHSIWGTISMPFSINIEENKEYLAVKKAMELLNEYNITIESLNLKRTNGEIVTIDIHDISIDIENVFEEYKNVTKENKNFPLVTQK